MVSAAAVVAASARPLRFGVRVSTNSIASALKSLRDAREARIPSSTPRIPRTSRLPVELGALLSVLPLHSTIASSRLVSVLAPESQSWGRIPLGLSMPL